MFGNILKFGRGRAAAGTLTLHTADWSAADLPDAPSADRILDLYERRFGHPVRASGERATTGAPQLAVDVDVSDLASLDRLIRRFWAGEPGRAMRDDPDHGEWRKAYDRLVLAKEMHARMAPMVHFPFRAAAVIAYLSMGLRANPFCTLTGYRRLEPGEAQARDLTSDAPPPGGALPPDRFEEGGHLFVFHHVSERSHGTVEDDWTVLIGPTGLHVDRLKADPRERGVLSMLDMRKHDMPVFLKPEPALDRTVPPPEARLSVTLQLRHDRRAAEDRVRDAERVLGTALHGADGKPGTTAHIDLSDLPDWPQARDLLWNYADVTGHLDTLREATRRLSAVMKHPLARQARVTDTAALLMCLSQAWKGGSVEALRLAAVNWIHPYQLEKMSFERYPTRRMPPPDGPVTPKEPEGETVDGGLGCLFEIDGRVEKAWWEP